MIRFKVGQIPHIEPETLSVWVYECVSVLAVCSHVVANGPGDVARCETKSQQRRICFHILLFICLFLIIFFLFSILKSCLSFLSRSTDHQDDNNPFLILILQTFIGKKIQYNNLSILMAKWRKFHNVCMLYIVRSMNSPMDLKTLCFASADDPQWSVLTALCGGMMMMISMCLRSKRSLCWVNWAITACMCL